MSGKTVIQEDGTIKSFTDWVKADGSTDYKPEKGRYHLYDQHLCPYSHRTTITRMLKGLEDVITIDNMDYILVEGKGWKFSPEKEGCDADSVNGYEYLRQAYEESAKSLGATGFSGTVVVPTLYDKKLKRVVSNESADILRMFNSEFNEFCATPAQRDLDLFPEPMRGEIEQMEAWIQSSVVFGVYGPMMARSQESYDKSVENVFSGLDKVEAILAKNRYLMGKQLTEADIKLFVCLIRFDPVYFLLGCSKKRIADYPALWGFTRDIYQTGKVKDTVVMDEIMKGHFMSYKRKHINPHRIIPARQSLGYDQPHGREQL